MELLKRIENKQARLGVIGLGYVGLPLAVEFARAGFHVVGFDVDKSKVDALNSGQSYIPDVSSEHVAEVVKAGLFKATIDENALADVDIRFCRGTECRYFTTGSDGSYAFENVPAGWNSFELVPPEGSGLATAFAPVKLASASTRTIDLTIPALEGQTPISQASPTEIALGSGLLVTMAADDIAPPMFVDPATHAGGVLVPSALWPPIGPRSGVPDAVCVCARRCASPRST